MRSGTGTSVSGPFDPSDRAIGIFYPVQHILGVAMSSSPLKRLSVGDEDLASPFSGGTNPGNARSRFFHRRTA